MESDKTKKVYKMTNAKEELLRMLSDINKTEADIARLKCVTNLDYIENTKKEIFSIDDLDFEYSEGYGAQELFGLVLFNDGSWLERGEYDGAEWWEYKKPPTDEDFNSIGHFFIEPTK